MMRSKSMVVGSVCAVVLAACGGAVTTGDDETTTTSDTQTTVVATTSGPETTMSEPTATTVAEESTTSMAPTTTTTVDRSSTTPAGTVPENDGGEAVTGEVPQEFMDQVFAAAEAESGVDRSSMTVLRSESVIWSDGSLGCPEPGMMYTQATVDGYWVELSVGERVLDYRLSVDGQIRLCTSGAITGGPGDDS